jgi:hypothetical protein
MRRGLGVVGLFATVLAVYLLRLDRSAGLYTDDAFFIVLAKALAQGDGFKLISSTTPIQPAFPPGFPMLLAPLVWLSPSFPDNVLLLKSVSIAAMLAAGALTYLYLVRYRQTSTALAAIVAVLTVLLPAFVFLATSTVMADVSFTLAQLGVVLAIEHLVAAPPGRDTTRSVAAAAAITVATLLLRAAGVAAITAAAVYVASRRGLRLAALFAVLTGAGYAPWLIYSAAHLPSSQERVGHGGSWTYRYSELLRMRHGGEPSMGFVTVRELPARVGFNLTNIFGLDLGAVMLPAVYRGPGESGQEAFNLSGETGFRAGSMGGGAEIRWVASLLTAVAVIGFFAAALRRLTVAEYMVVATIAMVAFVPARTYRYLLPLAPFILFYFLNGIQAIETRFKPGPVSGSLTPAVRIVAACMALLFVGEHVQYIARRYVGPIPLWLVDYRETTLVTDWVKQNTLPDEIIATTNPGLVYLATGRKTVVLTDIGNRWPLWRAAGVRYAVGLHVIQKPSAESYPHTVRYETPIHRLWILQVIPPEQDR